MTLVLAILEIVRLFRSDTRFLYNVGIPKQSSRFAFVTLYCAVALTWYNVASCWLAQTIFYPIYLDMNAIGNEAFHAYSRAYLTKLHAIILPGGLMCIFWALSLWRPLVGVSRAKLWAIVMMCVAFVLVTPVPAGAQDDMFDYGYSIELYSRLIWSHTFRTVLFTVMGVLALLTIHDLVRNTLSKSPSRRDSVSVA